MSVYPYIFLAKKYLKNLSEKMHLEIARMEIGICESRYSSL